MCAAAGAFIGAAGTMMDMKSKRDAAKQAKKIGKFNAAVSMEDAREARESYQFEQERAVKEGKRVAGTMRALMGASGARMDIGAPVRAEAELASELTIDQMLIAIEGEKTAKRYENQARVAKMGGTLAAREYNAAATSSLLAGAGTLMQQYSQMKREGYSSGDTSGPGADRAKP